MAIKRMLVALWLRQTSCDDPNEKGTRMSELQEALEEAERCRQVYVSSHQFPAVEWGDPQLIFVAPEYLFSQPVGGEKRTLPNSRLVPLRTGGTQRHLSEDEANAIFRELQGLSRKYHHLLIVPGTIAWRKELGRYRNFDRSRYTPWPHEVLEQAYHKLHPEMVDAGTGQFTGNVATDTVSDLAKPLAGHTRVDWKDKVQAVQRAEQDLIPDFGLCLNTAPVLHDGKTVLIYHKHGDFYELEPSYDVNQRVHEIAFPGRKDGTFQLDGVDYGIEICFDHSIAALESAQLEKPHGTPLPQVHIITSASVALDWGPNVVRAQGYVVGAAAAGEQIGGADASGVWQVDGAGNRVPVPEARYAPPARAAVAGPAPPQRRVAQPEAAGSPFKLYAIRLEV